MKKLVIEIFLILIIPVVYCQNVIFEEIENNFKKGDTLTSLYLLQKTYEKAVKRQDTLTQIKILSIYERLYYEKNPFITKKYLSLKIHLLKNYSSKPNHIKELYESYLKLASVYEKTGDLLYAIYTYDKILKTFSKIPQKDSILYKIANNYYLLGSYNEALNFLKNISFINEQKLDTGLYLKTIFLEAKTYNKLNLFEQSLNPLFIAKTITQTYNHNLEKEINFLIAEITSKIELYSLSIKYLKEILEKYSPNQKEKIFIYKMLSEQFLELNMYDSAIFYAEKLKDLSFKTQRPKLLAFSYNIIAINLLNKKNFTEAAEYLNKAILVATKQKDTTELKKAYYLQSIILSNQKKYSKAIYYLNKSTTLSHNIFIDKKIYYELYKNYLQLENYQQAIEYLHKYTSINDSLTKLYKNIAINKTEAEIKWKNISKNFETEYLLLKKSRKQTLLVLVFLTISLLALIILLFLYIIKFKELSKSKKQIELQKQKIEQQYEKIKILSWVANNSTNSIFILDQNWKVIWVNDVLLNVYNTTKEKIFAEYNAEYSKITKANFEELKNTCEQGKNYIFISEFEINNETKYIQTHISPITDENQKYYIGIENDITDLVKARKELEKSNKDLQFKEKLLEIYNQELKEQKEEIIAQNEELRQQQDELILKNQLLEKLNEELSRLSIAVSESDNIIFFFNTNGKILWANSALIRLTGFTLEELRKQKGETIFEISSNPEIEYYFYLCLRQKRSVQYISELPTKFGKKIWTQTTLTPIKNEDGEVYQIVAIDSDITEYKKAELKILKQNEEIKKSLEYAQRIQRAILPMTIFIDSLLENYFIYYKPRDFVGGDFYYFYYKNDKIFCALADSTGHGIPGALMSILGSLAVQNTINQYGIEDLQVFFKKLNHQVNSILHKYSEKSTTFDSIDIGVCIIDPKNKSIDFAGANIPLFLYDFSQQKVIKIKPTKTTIGTFDLEEKNITVHKIFYKNYDRIFLATDGIFDQFGGRDNKRLRTDGFITLLEQLNKDEFSNFYINLDNFLKNWMGQNEQIDDILIIGIELP